MRRYAFVDNVSVDTSSRVHSESRRENLLRDELSSRSVRASCAQHALGAADAVVHLYGCVHVLGGLGTAGEPVSRYIVCA